MSYLDNKYYNILELNKIIDKLKEEVILDSNIDSLKNHVNDCYSIQRVLYSYCLIKWLKLALPNLTEQQIFENHFGGIYYIFLRGCNKDTGNGIYCQTWESWDDLEKAFKEIIKIKIGGINND